MSNQESDFRNMIAVFDHALSSDDPSVKQALDSLVMIVALTRDPYGDTDGPFKHMWLSFEDSRKEAQELKRMVDKLVREVDMLKTYPTDDRYRWKPWGNDIKGTSFNQVFIDEDSIVPGAAWDKNVIKQKVTK